MVPGSQVHTHTAVVRPNKCTWHARSGPAPCGGAAPLPAAVHAYVLACPESMVENLLTTATLSSSIWSSTRRFGMRPMGRSAP